MQRDREFCFKTGSLDGGPMERSRLELVPICQRPFWCDGSDGQVSLSPHGESS